MHDPMTVAHEIKSPFKQPSNLFPNGYRKTWVTIWHVDPEKDGTDDSCGWFKRARHGNKEHYAKIKREFEYDFDKALTYDDGRPMYLGWFHPSGEPLYSAHAIALGFFWSAALIHFEGSHRKASRFMRRYHHDIVWFAENPTDSMWNTITNHYNEKREQRIESLAAMVYGCILRWTSSWWRHPRWHVHHWKVQVHCVQNLKRWLFSRCSVCKRGFKWGESVIGHSWHGTGPLWFRSETHVSHDRCSGISTVSETKSPDCQHHD